MFSQVLAVFVFGMFAPLESKAELRKEGDATALIYMKDREALIREAARLQNEAIMRRACEIQRKQRSPPVSCFTFAQSAIEIQALTEDCRRLAPQALVLPAVDKSVSELCRQAIESRLLDLRYAVSELAAHPPRTPDASR